MLRSLLICALVASRITYYFIDPCSIHLFPVEFVAVLLEEYFQGTIFDAIIAA
jgi:hypothetical protein